MNIKELTKNLELVVTTGEVGITKELTTGYVCDLLSWVISHAPKGSAWVTVLNHVNIVAVAALTEVSCIILPEGTKPEEQTLKKAIEHGIPILCSDLDAYTLSNRIYTSLDNK